MKARSRITFSQGDTATPWRYYRELPYYAYPTCMSVADIFHLTLPGRLAMNDCAARVKGRIQITTNGHRVYLDGVEDAFGADVDYAQLQKIYGASEEPDTRYSPAVCIGCDLKVVSGDPDPKHASTSYVERQNLTMRMGMRRFTRLTNVFSKKNENHAAMVAIHFLYYNFGRIHKTLRVTPAMATGLSEHVWSLEEIILLAR